MNAELRSYFEQNLPRLHVAAWSARFSDGSIAVGRFNDWLPESRVEQTLSRLLNAAETLTRQGLAPERLCWTFELAKVHIAFRPGGACLALFVKNDRNAPSSDGVQLFLHEFVKRESL